MRSRKVVCGGRGAAHGDAVTPRRRLWRRRSLFRGWSVDVMLLPSEEQRAKNRRRTRQMFRRRPSPGQNKFRPACAFPRAGRDLVSHTSARPRLPGRTPPFCRAFSAGQNSQDALITLTLKAYGTTSSLFINQDYRCCPKIHLSLMDNIVNHDEFQPLISSPCSLWIFLSWNPSGNVIHNNNNNNIRQ